MVGIIVFQILSQIFVSYMITMRLYDAIDHFKWHTVTYILSIFMSVLSNLLFIYYVYTPSNILALLATISAMLSGTMTYITQWHIYNVNGNIKERVILFLLLSTSSVFIFMNMIYNDINYDKLLNLTDYTNFSFHEFINMTVYVLFLQYCMIGTLFTALKKILSLRPDKEVSRVILILFVHAYIILSLTLSYTVVLFGYMSWPIDQKFLLLLSSLTTVLMMLWQTVTVVFPDRFIYPLLYSATRIHLYTIYWHEKSISLIHSIIISVLPYIHLKGTSTIFDKQIEVDDGRRLLNLPASPFQEAILLLKYQNNISNIQPKDVSVRSTEASVFYDIAVALWLRWLQRKRG